jgi:uncharacterized iron-regulated protein
LDLNSVHAIINKNNMKTNLNWKNTTAIGLGLMVFTFTSCKKDDAKVDSPKKSYAQNISNIGSNVITETYKELASKAAILHSEVMKLKNSQTASNLDIARSSWRDTRVPWEKSEGFLFGPVDTKGIDPAIDSWPVNKIDLDAVLSGSDALTEGFIDALAGELKGFHTIEYLLWGGVGNKQISDFTVREFEYLLSVTENLKNKTKILADSWNPTGENYVKNLTKAGTSSSIYLTEKSALQEFVQGMIGIADEVANGKINDPLSQQDLTKEESQFSHNSKNDFANNIRSIANIYNGKFNINGLGIYDIVKDSDEALANRLNDELNEAITAIDNIPGTFSDAVFNSKVAVNEAKDKITVIQTTLESEILPIINKL